jgi:hypothetical protein
VKVLMEVYYKRAYKNFKHFYMLTITNIVTARIFDVRAYNLQI